MESAGVRYLRTRCFCNRNLTRSLRSLVRFLIRQQLVRKYRTPALSMKYSLYIIRRIHTVKTMAFSRLTFVSSVLRTSASHFWFPIKAQDPENIKVYLEKWKEWWTQHDRLYSDDVVIYLAIIPLALVGYEMIIANSYQTRTRGIIVKYTTTSSAEFILRRQWQFQG